MKRLLKIVLSVVIVFVFIAAGGMFFMTRGLETGSRQVVNSVNLTSLADGDYKGRYNLGRWTNEVCVTVKDHKITKIQVVKDVTFPKPEWTEQLFRRVMEKQNTDVDVVSGATITCKAYLKAIENALNKGR